ncbi:hypothetical protein BDF21DRAFT_396657 [Thamnidium elegans]|nr:hypothetical protein BDF21DRAFT_396657 [Thamnidium elegans]
MHATKKYYLCYNLYSMLIHQKIDNNWMKNVPNSQTNMILFSALSILIFRSMSSSSFKIYQSQNGTITNSLNSLRISGFTIYFVNTFLEEPDLYVTKEFHRHTISESLTGSLFF